MSVDHVLNVARILGIGQTPDGSPPEPELGYITLWMPEGITFGKLLGGNLHIEIETVGCEQEEWYTHQFPAGVYRLRIPVLENCDLSLARQKRLLRSNEIVAPALLVTVAFACLSLSKLPDPRPTEDPIYSAEVQKYGSVLNPVVVDWDAQSHQDYIGVYSETIESEHQRYLSAMKV